MNPENKKKPVCKLTGTNGNVFAIISTVAITLRKNKMTTEAKEWETRAFAAEGYPSVLRMATEYVEVG